MAPEGEKNSAGHETSETRVKLNRTTAASPSDYNGYRMVSDVLSNLMSMIVGIAWPVTALIILDYATQHGSDLVDDIQKLMIGNKQLEISADVKGGIHLVVIKEVEKGLSQQFAQEGSKAPKTDAAEIKDAAAQATSRLPVPIDAHAKTKILWVDDHPQNNIGLVYAFQVLGIIVVCVDGNDGIDEAFVTAGGFDGVITDMYRDAIGDKRAQPDGGLETVKIIKEQYGSVPVIIYASSYADHAKDPLQPPIVAITNDPRVVLNRVTEIASKKGNKI